MEFLNHLKPYHCFSDYYLYLYSDVLKKLIYLFVKFIIIVLPIIIRIIITTITVLMYEPNYFYYFRFIIIIILIIILSNNYPQLLKDQCVKEIYKLHSRPIKLVK